MAREVKIGTPFLREQPDIWAYGVVTGVSKSALGGTKYSVKFVEGHKRVKGRVEILEKVPLKPNQHTVREGQAGIIFLPHPDLSGI